MVIQRWQSVLLLIAVVLMGCFTFISLGTIQSPDFTFDFTSCGFYPVGEYTDVQSPESISTWYFFAVSLVSAILPLITIFSYKKFRLQERLCLWECLMLACVILIGAILGYTSIDGADVSWSSLVCAPFISLIAVIMAYQRICADHRKIASANRLR